MSFVLALIVLTPFVSALWVGLAYLYSLTCKPVGIAWFNIPALGAPFISFAGVLVGIYSVAQTHTALVYRPYRWLNIDDYGVYVGLLGDQLSLFMALFVTLVGALIHLYSHFYMRKDAGYGKFLAYLNLFMAMMLLLVLADGPLMMFVGWEGVGLCSYLLIGFYFSEAKNAHAGTKAFLVNRVGDFGFIIGLGLLYSYCGAYGFSYSAIEAQMASLPFWVIVAVGCSFFIGAMGKSAQLPLYVWLPDAMAGPTPVSALIHAATMVTAGVYMVVRFSFLYEHIPFVGEGIAVVGGVSALFAAVVATQQEDIKKILAYSTMSQLGYMMMAVGVGAYTSALFHVLTHAFFKALLFLGAGALIVMMHHEQNIFKMAPMKNASRTLYISMLIGTLCISGIPPFSGFFSKDELLLNLFVREHYVLWGMGMFGSLLTSYYMFRLFFVLFETGNSAKTDLFEPLSLGFKLPIAFLALGTLILSFVGIPPWLGTTHIVATWLAPWQKESLHVNLSTELTLIALTLGMSLLGIMLAYVRWIKGVQTEKKGFFTWVYSAFYIDVLYESVFVRGLFSLSQFIAIKSDTNLINALVMGIAKGFVRLGNTIAIIQNANVRWYAFVMLLGISALSVYMLLRAV